jgi:hypothetical protein
MGSNTFYGCNLTNLIFGDGTQAAQGSLTNIVANAFDNAFNFTGNPTITIPACSGNVPRILDADSFSGGSGDVTFNVSTLNQIDANAFSNWTGTVIVTRTFA